MDWSTKGLAALEKSDGAAEAVVHFTRALLVHPTSPDYFAQRATALSRLKPPRHDLALRDAEYAVLLGQQRAKREKMQTGQHRRMVALYGLGRFEDAKDVLVSMQRWRPKDSKKDKMENDIWMAKIQGKLKNASTAEGRVVVSEIPAVELPNEKALKTWLKSQLKADGSFGYDGDMSDLPATSITSKETASGEQTESAVTTTGAETTTVQPVRHDFYQNTDNVIVSFYAKKVDPATVTFKVETGSFHLSFPHPDDATTSFSYSANPAFGKIDPTNSKHRVMGTKIEVTLAKADKGQQWKVLQGMPLEESSSPSATGQQTKPKPEEAKLPNPYVTKAGQADWDKRVAEITKKKPKKEKKAEDSTAEPDRAGSGDEEDDDDGYESDPVGGDAVDGFFKKLYAGADADTRKAMMKSFSESNGTALSTNWSEVSKGKVEEVQAKNDEDD